MRNVEAVTALDALAGLPFRQDVELGTLNGHPIFGRRLDGPKRAPGWEMHPDTDELFHVLDGHMEVVLMTADGHRTVDLPAGAMYVIPRGHWHQPATHMPSTLLFMTPGTTEWLDGTDATPPAPSATI